MRLIPLTTIAKQLGFTSEELARIMLDQPGAPLFTRSGRLYSTTERVVSFLDAIGMAFPADNRPFCEGSGKRRSTMLLAHNPRDVREAEVDDIRDDDEDSGVVYTDDDGADDQPAPAAPVSKRGPRR